MKRKPTPLESPPLPSATTSEGKENELISLAYELVKQRFLNGTASSAETVHFLKLGSAKERLEMKKTEKELELMEAKKEALESAKHIEDLYTNAIKAMREYSMFGGDDYYEEGEQ